MAVQLVSKVVYDLNAETCLGISSCTEIVESGPDTGFAECDKSDKDDLEET
jgi:hypothetical protein